MARPSYLTSAHWKCVGPFFNFVHEESSALGSCMVIGKVSRHGSFFAPYGDFNINECEAHEMRRANFLFTLVRPDDDCGSAFQTDFDKCIIAIQSIVDHFREIKTAKPFATVGSEGPSLNFSHKVFERVRLL